MKKLCEKIMVSQKELHDVNFERLKNKVVYIINIFIDSETNVFDCRFIDRYQQYNNWFKE